MKPCPIKTQSTPDNLNSGHCPTCKFNPTGESCDHGKMMARLLNVGREILESNMRQAEGRLVR